ncbi:MAG: class I SAM-dependent methyltransferase [Pseudomonadota bacterium]
MADNWSQYWSEESPQGEVFVDASGEKHPALDEFWQTELRSRSANDRLLDIAAGAGSIIAALDLDRFASVHACDLSEPAMQRLAARFPTVKTAVCDATGLPYDDGAFDIVVSQYGIEYAGLDAFSEAARVLAPGGHIVTLSHYRGGSIDNVHERQLQAVDVLSEHRFIDKATELVSAAFTDDRGRFDRAAEDFIPSERAVAATVKEQPHGVHVHLHGGFRQLYAKRRQYDLSDITQWLAAMRDDVSKSIERLNAIRSVALDEISLATVRDNIIRSGLQWQQPTPFFGSDPKLPAAWVIRAHKAPS